MSLDPEYRVVEMTYNGEPWPIGVDTSGATAGPFDIAEGKTAYVNDQKITGMAGVFTQSAMVSLNLWGTTTLPASGAIANTITLTPPTGFEDGIPVLCTWTLSTAYFVPCELWIDQNTYVLSYMIANWDTTSGRSGSCTVGIRWYK